MGRPGSRPELFALYFGSLPTELGAALGMRWGPGRCGQLSPSAVSPLCGTRLSPPPGAVSVSVCNL